MAKLIRAVFVRDKTTSRDVLLNAGEEPPAKYAVLVTNPACWEGGKLPAAVKRHLADNGNPPEEPDNDDEGNDPATAQGSSGDSAPSSGAPAEDTKTATKKATSPARGRKTAAAEGTGGGQ